MTKFVLMPLAEQLARLELLMAGGHLSDNAWAAHDKMLEAEIWQNDVYQVIKGKPRPDEDRPGQLEWHLQITRLDQKPIHNWDDLQAIKNEFAGEDAEAIEIYPMESRKVDTANSRHLWTFLRKFRLPFGYES